MKILVYIIENEREKSLYCLLPNIAKSNQMFLCASADIMYIDCHRRLSPEDAGNYMVNVRNKFGEKANHVRLSMKVIS